MGGAQSEAKAYRILYRSTGLGDEPIAVSGAIFVPAGPAPKDGRPIVAWAHPTSGVVDRCAPSVRPDLSGTIPGLEDLLNQGYIVAATDYEGLGTPGDHPYLFGVSEARSVLDSVRAARGLRDSGAGNQFAVWGHSQGGQAALFAGQLAAAYAPELKLVGIAAAAPPTDLAELFELDRGTESGNSLTAMAIYSWAKRLNLPIDQLVKPDAMPAVERVANDCIRSIGEFLKEAQDEDKLDAGFLIADPSKLPAWRSIMTENSPSQELAGVAVLLIQGDGDKTVRPAVTRNYFDQLCHNGVAVEYITLEHVTHIFTGVLGAPAAVKWIT
ncbi:MAG TPA: alpha/beta fold hydrolase, partial [Hyphomicrobium sp.]|nr:alpha/beta fold hydrolase [Hyphomicrobium sp.]